MRRVGVQLRDMLRCKGADGRAAEPPMNNVGALAVLVLAALLAVACAQGVSVSISGPEELAGADVFVDGRVVGQLARIHADESTTAGLKEAVEGAGVTIHVSLGSHDLRIVKLGFRPIVRTLQYGERGEDYIAIEDEEVSAIEAKPAS